MSSRIQSRLAPYNAPRLKVPSRMLQALMFRAAETNGEYVNRIIAYGIYGKTFALRLYEMAKAQQEAADAGPRELAPAGEQPADRAEAVRDA
jgi:hypothetical protein